jgi:cellulose synthase/poly-beta-1,6-N-acetylglucosamine synthase-like glycosyltransferase
MVTLLIAAFFIIFVGLHVVLVIGLFFEYLQDKGVCTTPLTTYVPVSIIIPVHNEAARISELLQSLLIQDYPFIELLFIDDRSTDETVSKITEFSKQFNHDNHTCRVLSLTENPGPNYKQVALRKGFEAATGELLLLTDADCDLPPTWVSGMVKRMINPVTGLVIGPTFKKVPQPTILYKTQAFDHAIRYWYVAAATAIGNPGGGFGNNIIVRKSALDVVGGYSAVPFSVTEDAALISCIAKGTNYTIRAGLGADIRVLTASEPTWKQFFIQTLRWTKGGIFSSDTSTRFSFSLLMWMIILGMLAIPCLCVRPILWPLPVAVWVAMLMNTFVVLAISGDNLKDFSFFDFLIQIFCIPMFNAILTLLVLFRIFTYWKGKKV